MGKDSDSETVTRTEIPAFLQPFVKKQAAVGEGALTRLEGMLSGAGADELVAGFDPLQEEAFGLAADRARGGGGFLPAAERAFLSTAEGVDPRSYIDPAAYGALESTASGDFLYGGEGFDAAVEAAVRAAAPGILSTFGGAGGLHVCALADALGMDQALVPVHGGVLSALGMLVAPPGRQLSHSRPGRLEDLDEADLEQGFAGLEAEGRASLSVEGVTDPVAQRSLDLRYEGQASTLSVPWRGLPAAAADFHAAHREAYGHALDMPVELVNLRLGLAGSPPSVPLPAPAAHTPAGPVERLAVHGVGSGVPVYRRSELAAGQRLAGPVIVTEAVATTWIEPGWSVEVDGSSGNLLLSRTK